jgi:hypothetical protein
MEAKIPLASDLPGGFHFSLEYLFQKYQEALGGGFE